MKFEKCKRPCRYRAKTYDVNGCDYLYLTGKLRGCPAGEECDKFEAGERESSRVDLVIPERSWLGEGEHLGRQYAGEQKLRILKQTKANHKY